MRIKTKNVIELHDLDELVVKTYGRTYSFQQQDGCKSRGIVEVTIPESHPYDFNRDTVPEVVNGNEMGVSFAAWLARDAKQLIPSDTESLSEFRTGLWWDRNFYPHHDMVLNDLHSKGLIPAGEYIINIDW